MSERWFCLDVGEVLIDETRISGVWAQVLGVSHLTFGACFGAAIVRDGDEDPFALLGVDVGADDWRTREPEVQARYGGFAEEDLYPDAWRAVTALQHAGYLVAVMGNQPARRHAELRALGVFPDAMAMSEELGAEKPDPAFFARALGRMGGPEPSAVAYVGDRVDNDVLPARAAGLRSVWLRRGPFGRLQQAPDGAADLVVSSLDELVERAAEAFAEPTR